MKWRERYRAGVGASAWNLLGASIQLPFGAILLASASYIGVLSTSELMARTHGWELVKSLGLLVFPVVFGLALGAVLAWYGFAMLADGLGARRTVTGTIERRTVHPGKAVSYSVVVYSVVVKEALVWVPREVYQSLREGMRVKLECGRFERKLNMLWTEE